MEALVKPVSGITASFWNNRRVFVTGHTGFKGSWLSLWLKELGAQVSGFALNPSTEPALFSLLNLQSQMTSHIADVRDATALSSALKQSNAEVVFHLAAQPLVRASYTEPLQTYATNVMGTANLLEAVRHQASVRAVVVVTTDKCYENREWLYGYRELDRLGGHDPYSSSKACAELVTQAYRDSFFAHPAHGNPPVGIATARAGNVIGGGDWAMDRLLPDAMRAFCNGQSLTLRYPSAVRPWQHVLEPIGGYLMLAERLYHKNHDFQGPWNFGPNNDSVATVQAVVAQAAMCWEETYKTPALWKTDTSAQPTESMLLLLDSTKSQTLLGWRPILSLHEAIQKVVAFTHAWEMNEQLDEFCVSEIKTFQARISGQSQMGLTPSQAITPQPAPQLK